MGRESGWFLWVAFLAGGASFFCGCGQSKEGGTETVPPKTLGVMADEGESSLHVGGGGEMASVEDGIEDAGEDELGKGKTSLPIDVDLYVEEKTVEPGKVFTLRLDLTPRAAVKRLIARFEVETGKVEFEGKTALVFADVTPDHTYSATLRAYLNKEGRAQIRGYGISSEESGETPVSASKSLYFFSSEKYAAVSKIGFSEPRIAVIKMHFEAGDISIDEYESLIQQVRTGGAATTVSQP